MTPQETLDQLDYKFNHSPNGSSTENIPIGFQPDNYHIDLPIPFSNGEYHASKIDLEIKCIHIYPDTIQIGIETE